MNKIAEKLIEIINDLDRRIQNYQEEMDQLESMEAQTKGLLYSQQQLCVALRKSILEKFDPEFPQLTGLSR